MKNTNQENVIDEISEIENYQKSIESMFEELPFKEKWMKVKYGLQQPKDTGDYKWAKLQMLRLLSPVLAVAVPVLSILLMCLLSMVQPEQTNTITVTVIEPEPIEEIEEIIEPEITPPETPEPVDIQMDISSDMPSLPSETVSPPAEVASVQPAPFDSVAIVKSPVIMKSIMGSRSPGAQCAALGKFGGGHTSGAVLRALRWLAKTQNSDGSWGKDKPSMTALAILAYMAHGDTPASDEFGKTVEAALRFIVEAQETSGRFKGRDGHDYTQPIVAYALCEAAGMTKVPQIREAAIKAVQVVVKGQNPSGSFNYNLIPNERNDLSYAGWCVQAMKAAHIAELDNYVDGLTNAMQRSIKGIKWHYAENNGYGGFNYASPGVGGLTGVGILCLQFLGEAKSKEVKSSIPTLEKYPFSWGKDENVSGKVDIYYWYYNTQACFQEGGAVWDSWNKQYSFALVKEQTITKKDASGYVDHKGEPQDIGWWEGCPLHHSSGNSPVMDTVLCTLMLEVYYRYLPTFQAIPDQEIKNALESDKDIPIEIN